MSGDLISRQAALNQITAIDTSIIPYGRAREYVDELKNYFIKIIESLPSAEPDRRWIPVTEAMPEEDKDVLLLMAEGEMAVGQRRGVNYWDGYRRRAVIIAWMSLPEPWRGE